MVGFVSKEPVVQSRVFGGTLRWVGEHTFPRSLRV